jgi:hypothetical protein
MGVKVFLKKPMQGVDLELVSDERDIMLPMSLGSRVLKWCEQNDIQAEPVNKNVLIQTLFTVTLWRIHNDQQRVAFVLKWS